jgi:hypothetical protein
MLKVDLLDVNDHLLGDGPLTNLIDVSVTEKLDEVGSIAFRMPATDDKAIGYVDTALGARVTAPDGFTATGLIRDRRRSINPPLLNVSGPDLLAELSARTVGWLAVYNTDQGSGVYGNDINSTILPDLLRNTGWSAGSIEASLGLWYGSLNGESRLSAINVIRQRVGKHIRQGSTARTLDLGAFGTAHGFRLHNVTQILKAQDGAGLVGLIDALEVNDDEEEVCNLIVPYGAGEDGSFLVSGGDDWGKVRLVDLLGTGVYSITDIKVRPGIKGAETTTTSGSSGTTLNVVSTTGFRAGERVFIGDKTNADSASSLTYWSRTIASITDGTHLVISSGSYTGVAAGLSVISAPQYYLYDATAYAANPREITKIFSEIDVPYRSALGSNIAQFVPAAKALYDRAKKYLAEHQVARSIYRVTPVTVPIDLRVGQTVRLEYHGKATRNGVAQSWLDVSADLFVLSITRTYNADGSTSAALEVSDVARQHGSDGKMIAELMSSHGVLQTRI